MVEDNVGQKLHFPKLFHQKVVDGVERVPVGVLPALLDAEDHEVEEYHQRRYRRQTYIVFINQVSNADKKIVKFE